MGDGSFHIAFQHREQLPQHALTLLGIGCVLNTVPRVLLNDQFGKRFQRPAHRDNLGEHIRAIAVFADHSLDGGDLSGNLAQADLKRPIFAGRVDVGVYWHC